MDAHLDQPITPWQAEVIEQVFSRPTRADIARLFEIPPGLLGEPDSPPRGIITALPPQPACEPDLRADLFALYRRLLRDEPGPVWVAPEIDTHGRVAYQYLDDAEREALHQWCLAHRVDYKQVPIDGLIELDPATNEWRIEIYRTRGGKHYLDQDGDIARTILRRAHKTDLPWRRP